MSKFIVSARKYRPAKFSEVIGQQPITVTLKNAVVSGHIAQAYLFCGPRGVGKTTVARILAKAINCSRPGKDGEPCNQCESCVSFNENRSFNIHELDAASNNKVDDIKNLIDQVRIPPQIGHYSVYIIDEVHMLSATAFNAFLKTLEEPPGYAVFILATTEKQKIIPTILSRCQIYDFQRIGVDDIVRHLKFVAGAEGVEADDDSLNIIARKADGALRDALSTFDQLISFSGTKLVYEQVIQNLNILDYDYYFRITEILNEGDFENGAGLLDEILAKGFDVRDIISGLANHFRELLLAQNEKTVSLMEVGKAVREKYLKQAGRLTPDFIKEALELTYQSDITLRGSRNQRLHAEILMLQICGLKKKPVGEPPEEISPGKTRKPVTEPQKLEKSTVVTQSAGGKVLPQQADNSGDPENAVTDRNVKPPVTESTEPAHPEKEKTKLPGTEKKETSGKTLSAPETVMTSHDPDSISIRDVLSGITNGKEEHENADTVSDADADTGYVENDEEITKDSLTKVWLDYADFLQQEKPRFASALRTHLPVFQPPATIHLVFENKNLLEDFERNLKSDLLVYLVMHLKNRKIDFDIMVEKNTVNKKPYTSEEKYQRLKARNPEIENLRKQFDLDFE